MLRENEVDSEVQRPIMTEILERVDRLNTAVQDLLGVCQADVSPQDKASTQ